MKTATQFKFEIIKYLNEQFPATIGHIPIADKLNELRTLERIDALQEAARVSAEIEKRCGTGLGISKAILNLANNLTPNLEKK